MFNGFVGLRGRFGFLVMVGTVVKLDFTTP